MLTFKLSLFEGHPVDSPSRAGRVLAVITAALLLLLSGSMAWATAYEYQTRRYIPAGVTVAGASLGGLSHEEASSIIASAVTGPLMRPVEVLADGKTFTYDPKGAVQVDTESMVSDAFAPRRAASFAARLRHDLAGTPLGAPIEPAYTVDGKLLEAWVESVAAKVDRPARDATVTAASGEVTLTPSLSGRSLKVRESVSAIQAAFRAEAALGEATRTVTLVVEELAPKVTEKDLGKTIVVDLSKRQIWLFDGATLEKTYPCAIGTRSHPTPTGHFTIEEKRRNPGWSNPAPKGWGKDMPAYIPPGPGNPLGTRALNLSASGIRFHGTNKIHSIGTAASHGCMRMYRKDIEDFFERVEVGTNVYIFP